MTGGILSRRTLLKVLGVAATVPLPACSSKSETAAAGSGFFTDPEKRALGALANAVLPPEGGTPGGSDLGAAAYIERLCTAFDVDPPAIFASGPYSGRNPFADGTVPPNDFAHYMPLDRVTDKAWRIKILGSKAVDGGTLNAGIVPEVTGLRNDLKDALGKVMAGKPPLETLPQDQLRDAFNELDKDVQNTLIALFSEAAFGAPEYGGNPALAGWGLAHFEGDTQPLGYSVFDGTAYHDRPEAPMTGPNTVPDPAPFDDGTRKLLSDVVAFANGKVFP